jgi:hypothetical protein
MTRIIGIRREQISAKVVRYWIAIDGYGEEKFVDVEELMGIRLFRRDDLAKSVGDHAAALICRILDKCYSGESIDLPLDISVD